MNNKIKIQSGQYKGKSLDVPPKIHGHSCFTSGLIKKTVFSLIDSFCAEIDLTKQDTIFVDLFAGSGQMGIEAMSRGYKRTIFIELAKNRIAPLASTMHQFQGDFLLYNRDAFRHHSKFAVEPEECIAYFIDCPYSFWTEPEKIHKLVLDILNSHLENKKIIIVQTNVSINWTDFELRTYGKNNLLIYKKK